MLEDFDPYHTWLSIPPEEQPATFYRLLALRPFEDKADVIENAADQRMAHLRTFQRGEHSKLSQKLLNEVATAKVCLLNKERKGEYDQDLREELRRRAEAASKEKASATPAGFWQHVEGCTLVSSSPNFPFDHAYTKNLEAFTDIEHLTLIGFGIAASGIAGLRRLSKLRTVYVSDCGVLPGENVSLPTEHGQDGTVRVRAGLYSVDAAARERGQNYLLGPEQWSSALD